MTPEQRDAELVRLAQAMAALTREVEALQAAEHRRREPTMRNEARCPSCGGRRLIHASEVLDRDSGGRNEMALAQPSLWSAVGVGKLETFVCATCGLCEWWVKDVSELVQRMEAGKLSAFHFIGAEDKPDKPGPYR